MVNPHLELNFIARLMTDRNPELLVQIDRSVFGNEELSKVFLLIRKFYLDTGSFPGWDVLRSDIIGKCSGHEKIKFMSALLDKIQDRDITGLTNDKLVAELQAAGKCRTILNNCKELTAAAENRDIDAVQSLYRKGYEQAFLKADIGTEQADLLHMAGADVKFNWKTTGVKAIDERNGVAAGSLVLLGGDTGTGKSTLAHSIAVHQFQTYGDSIFYASWEQGTKEIMSRVFSYCSGVDLGKIIDDDLTTEERGALRRAKLNLLFDGADLDNVHVALSEEEFLREAAKKYPRKPNSFYLYDDIGSFDDLIIRMELLRSTRGVSTFVCDYLTIIPPGAEHRGMQSWEVYIKMAQKLKNFARIHGCIVITPVQFDAKEGKIRFSQNIKNDADLALFLSQDNDDKTMDTVTVEFGKYRNFKTIPNKPLQSFKLTRDFAHARFLELTF